MEATTAPPETDSTFDPDPPAGKEESAPRKLTNYVVLASKTSDGQWVFVDTVEAPNQLDAKRQIAEQQSIEPGEAISLVAIPESSWKPTVVRVEVPTPRVTFD